MLSLMNHYKEVIFSPEFKLLGQPEFLIDNEGNLIKWTSTIFIQPQDEREFKLPKIFKCSVC